ncbi:MAG: NUDIX hydrolase [Actinobacteria bacterium]|nr:NUDIX hydrolase [Actinomycetota bacterium]
MPDNNEMPRWLEWAREIQGLCQTGLAFASTDYETQRYTRLTEIAAEIVASHTGEERGELVKGFSAQPGYATAKIDVRGAVVRDGRILLVQERRDQHWCMPGGWADVGDIPSEMVAREVWEESGFEVAPRKVIAVYDANRGGRPLEFFHAYKIIFLCDIISGEPRVSDETMAVDFFSFDELPPLSWQRTSEKHLDEVRAHLEDECRPAAFD